jgi:hypothetical protein
VKDVPAVMHWVKKTWPFCWSFCCWCWHLIYSSITCLSVCSCYFPSLVTQCVCGHLCMTGSEHVPAMNQDVAELLIIIELGKTDLSLIVFHFYCNMTVSLIHSFPSLMQYKQFTVSLLF